MIRSERSIYLAIGRAVRGQRRPGADRCTQHLQAGWPATRQLPTAVAGIGHRQGQQAEPAGVLPLHVPHQGRQARRPSSRKWHLPSAGRPDVPFHSCHSPCPCPSGTRQHQVAVFAGPRESSMSHESITLCNLYDLVINASPMAT